MADQFFPVANYGHGREYWRAYGFVLAWPLMHIYTRFSRYQIFPEKSKCISCNVCTAVCHQGIDIMNFANKGLPMEDPIGYDCRVAREDAGRGSK